MNLNLLIKKIIYLLFYSMDNSSAVNIKNTVFLEIYFCNNNNEEIK